MLSVLRERFKNCSRTQLKVKNLMVLEVRTILNRIQFSSDIHWLGSNLDHKLDSHVECLLNMALFMFIHLKVN